MFSDTHLGFTVLLGEEGDAGVGEVGEAGEAGELGEEGEAGEVAYMRGLGELASSEKARRWARRVLVFLNTAETRRKRI